MRVYQLSIRKLSLSIITILFLTLFTSQAYATDSTSVPLFNKHVRYWSCTNTTVVDDPADSGYWWADMRMGDQYTQCWDAGSGANPSNSIPRGIVAWGAWDHNDIRQGKGRLLCAHVVPVCGWVNGPAPNQSAP